MIYLPVLIIRAYHQPTPDVERIHYRRILLPIDSSRRSESTLSVGIALARRKTSTEMAPEEITQPPTQPDFPTPPTKLVLTAVIKPPELPIPEPYPNEIIQLSQQLMDLSKQALSYYMNEMKGRLPVDSEIIMLENVSVSAAIQELASQGEDIDLVVLCAHGYTGQFTWPYGSVARNFIEHGSKHVLIIQDVPHSEVPRSAAEIAAEKSGGR